MNPDIFPQHLFAAAATTDIPDCETGMNLSEMPIRHNTPVHEREDGGTTEQRNTSKTSETAEVDARNKKIFPTPPVPIATISPIPSTSCHNRVQRRQKAKKTPTILTNSPYVKELRKKCQEKDEKEKRVAAQRAKKQLSFGKEQFYEEDLDLFDSEDCPCLYCNELKTW